MPEIKNHTPGAFCWAEVGTVNAKKTKAFYSELFGWKYEDKPAGEFGVYSMCKSDGKELAGLYEMPPNLLQMGVPPHWMSYVAVTNADAAAKKIAQHGGKIQQGPFDVMDVGRMAICTDPTGATFSIWQAKAHKGATLMGEKGTPSWFELTTKDLDKAEKFYRDVFGWSVKKGGDYREITAAGAKAPQGGMMELAPHHGPVPPHWKIYFTVEDCDGDTQRVKTLGGKVLVPPMDIPDVGRFSVVSDPAGATFALFQLAFDPKHKSEQAQAQPVAPAARPKSTPKKK